MPKQKQSRNASEEPQAKKARLKSQRSGEEDETQDDTFNASQSADFDVNSSEAEYGIVEKVCVKNFICHGRLSMNFGPNINFVVGRNGSGKSAILTAIVVGLGGKATATTRGSSVKNFIKEGKSVAEIRITLRNRGDFAYKPKEYGDSIIVERKLRKEGGSTYKLMSSSEKVISTKREELSSIVDFFNIQVDNPVSIMTQETSKNFLQARKASDKYKFFMKATQLDQISRHYSEIAEKKKEAEDKIKMQSEQLPDLEKEVLDLEQKFKAVTCLHDLEEKKQSLLRQEAWAIVMEQEQKRDKVQMSLQKEESRTPKFDDKIKTEQAKVLEAEEKFTKLQNQIEDFRRSMEDLKPQYDATLDNKRTLKATAKGFEKELKQKRSEKKGLEADRDDLLKMIKEEKEKDKAQFEEKRLARERKIDDLKEQKKTLEAQRENSDREIGQFKAAIDRAGAESYDLRLQESGSLQSIRAIRQRLTDLEGSKKNRLKLFGDYVPALQTEINRCATAREFNQKPLGPIGTFLTLKNDRWALGVEACLKTLLFSFCCHDQHDARILKRIMGRVVPPDKSQPAIITARFESRPYDIQAAAVQTDAFPAFLDIVAVSNPVIFNTLVDQRRVENILLIERSQDARQFLRHTPPPNCREAFTMAGDQVYAGAEQRFYASMQKEARILRGNIDGQIRDTKKELTDKTREQEQVREELKRLQQIISENDSLKKRAQRQRSQLQDRIGGVNNQVLELEGEAEGEQEASLAELEGEVWRIEEQITTVTQKVEQLAGSFREASNRLKEAIEQYDAIDLAIQEISNRLDPLKDEMTQASLEVEGTKQARKHYEDKKKELLASIANLSRQLAEEMERVNEELEKATQICPERPEDLTRGADNIRREVAQLAKQIRKEKKLQGDPDIITEAYNEKKQKYSTVETQIESSKKMIRVLEDQLNKRIVRLNDLRRYIAKRTKYFFLSMMSTRGYSGQIKFNHVAGELNLIVDSDQSKALKGRRQDTSATDVRSLSGGERSFSTVCLIMALWESIESPFRVMDEFDVFMDMMNRRICMEMMQQFAKDQSYRQFIFLTPQDM
ncbi:structural maintenance of chromosomes protein 6-like, partial [Diadema antillarum]|uniref:structural maintenance of chromosomes protein 6-like n=1 Tax=Diadema antillarum TaxID=105358 RepID=UPI003A846FC5